MGKNEIINLVNAQFDARVGSILNGLDRAELWVSTKEACKVLNRSDKWLKTHKEKFEFKRKNGRGDLQFRLTSLVNFINQ